MKNTIYRFVLALCLVILCGTMVARVNCEPATGPHPTLTAEERELLSQMLAEMYGPKPEKTETAQTLNGSMALEVKPIEKAETAQTLSGPVALKATVKSEPTYTEEELEILAIIIFQEAGGDYASDETRLRVGNVFLNRVNDPRFPDTFEEVATAEGQYGTLHWTGIKWPDRAQYAGEAHAVERAYELAKRLLEGERVLPDDVIFQSEYIMGEIVASSDGLYFCR